MAACPCTNHNTGWHERCTIALYIRVYRCVVSMTRSAVMPLTPNASKPWSIQKGMQLCASEQEGCQARC
jgi:hypothetical protein